MAATHRRFRDNFPGVGETPIHGAPRCYSCTGQKGMRRLKTLRPFAQGRRKPPLGNFGRFFEKAHSKDGAGIVGSPLMWSAPSRRRLLSKRNASSGAPSGKWHPLVSEETKYHERGPTARPSLPKPPCAVTLKYLSPSQRGRPSLDSPQYPPRRPRRGVPLRGGHHQICSARARRTGRPARILFAFRLFVLMSHPPKARQIWGGAGDQNRHKCRIYAQKLRPNPGVPRTTVRNYSLAPFQRTTHHLAR